MCGKCSRYACLCPFSFGLAWGVVFALFVAGIAWMAWLTGAGSAMVEQMSGFYHGYEASVVGGLWGLLWGFIEGIILGFFIALFYNSILKCCGRCFRKSNGEVCTCPPSAEKPKAGM